MKDLPSLGDLLAACGAGGTLIRAIIGFVPRTTTLRQLVENIALGAAVGVPAGVAVAFAIWIPITIAGQ